jgi:hypothetical protein
VTSRSWAWLRAALALGILGYSGWQLASAWSALEPSALSLRPLPAALSGLLGASALLTLALVSGLGARAARLGQPGPRFLLGWLRVWFQGYFYRYAPGKVLLVVERVRLGERLGVPRAASVMLVLWESLLLLAGAGLIGGLGLLMIPRSQEQPVSALSVALLAAACLLASLLLGPLLQILAARVPALGRRLPGAVLEVSPGAQLALVLGNALAWALLGASFALCARALQPDGEGAAPPLALLVVWFVASYVGGQVTSVAPAGLGVREGLLVAGLAGVVPAPVALAWAVAHRIGLSLVELVLVGLSLLVELPVEREERGPAGFPDGEAQGHSAAEPPRS